ncbi:MAG: hypothetical protein ACPGES_00765 [Coraliomargarita sp.]
MKKHTRGGHFGPWLRWFATEFAERFEEVVVITPYPNKSKQLFCKSRPPNIRFHKLPSNLKHTLSLDDLNNKYGRSNRAYYVIMWAFDLEKLNLPSKLPPWATFTIVSRMTRQPEIEGAELEAHILKRLDEHPNCVGFVQSDDYIQTPSSKAVWLPDIEDVELLDKPTEQVQKLSHFANQSLTIGCFGILTGPRCINETVELARQNPTIQFALVGKIRADTISEPVQDFLDENPNGNLYIHEGFIETEAELNSCLNAVDCVLIDGTNYPQQSGIASKALHFGKAIISPESNSWVSDLIQHEGAGISYKSPNYNLIQSWEEWRRKEGPARNQATSNQLRSAPVIQKSFDDITRRLKNA